MMGGGQPECRILVMITKLDERNCAYSLRECAGDVKMAQQFMFFQRVV
jgi:hypothetical protein